MKSAVSVFLRRARTCVFRKRGKVKAEMQSFTTRHTHHHDNYFIDQLTITQFSKIGV